MLNFEDSRCLELVEALRARHKPGEPQPPEIKALLINLFVVQLGVAIPDLATSERHAQLRRAFEILILFLAPDIADSDTLRTVGRMLSRDMDDISNG